jgi:hypothetical protein
MDDCKEDTSRDLFLMQAHYHMDGIQARRGVSWTHWFPRHFGSRSVEPGLSLLRGVNGC